MLEGIQAEVGELGDFITGCPHPENSAGILRAAVVGEELMREETITTGHDAQPTGAAYSNPAPRSSVLE